MKPDLKMEETKVPVNVIVQPKSEGSSIRDRSNRKLIVGVSIGIFAAVALAGVIIGAYFLGTSTRGDYYKEAKMTGNGIESTIKVSIHEEIIRTDGGLKVVRDFQRGLETMRSGVSCFVAPLRQEVFASPEDVMPGLHDAEAPSDIVLELLYVATGEPVNPGVLSEAAREMCAGLNTVWARMIFANVTKAQTRRRRQAGCGNLFAGAGINVPGSQTQSQTACQSETVSQSFINGQTATQVLQNSAGTGYLSVSQLSAGAATASQTQVLNTVVTYVAPQIPTVNTNTNNFFNDFFNFFQSFSQFGFKK